MNVLSRESAKFSSPADQRPEIVKKLYVQFHENLCTTIGSEIHTFFSSAIGTTNGLFKIYEIVLRCKESEEFSKQIPPEMTEVVTTIER